MKNLGTESDYDPEIKPLSIILPQESTHVKCYDETKLMQFFIKNDRLIKYFDEIWNETSKM